MQARLLVLAVILSALGSADAAGSNPGQRRCARLASLSHPGFEILAATWVPAGTFTAGDGQAFVVPGSCRVTGRARPTADSRVGFELWLPDGWNGRYSQLGNGGFAGNIDAPSLASEIRRGNAAAMTDTGHKAGQFDASWALGHPQRVIDYGYRSIRATADAANRLLRDYYGRAPRRRYYIGCSNGGRQALMAAQRYPDDWDGILAGSPAVEWTRQLATFAAIQHRLRASPENWIPSEKLPAIQRAALSVCPLSTPDPSSSAASGACRLDVAKLLCPGKDNPNCLTPAQASSLDLIQSGPKSRGAPYFHGFSPTSAATPEGWAQWILNPDRGAPSQLAFATQAYRYLVQEKPAWRIEEFDPDRDLARPVNRIVAGLPLPAVLDAADPDLRTFAGHGGKLIIYVGGADPVISPAAAVAYYRRVMRHMGDATALRFSRLFVVPGMQHCQGGPGPNAFGQARVAPALRSDADHDVRLALEAWVEQGRTPHSITAARSSAGGTPLSIQRLRPYPAAAGAIMRARP